MESILSKIKKRDIYVFVFTLIIGLFAHSFMIFNKISFFDDLSSIYGFSAKHLFSLGRFSIAFLKIISDKLFGSFSSPIINGIISIFFICLSNIVIARLFDIKKIISIALLSSIIILSTGYICLQAYLFTAVYYTLAIFLSLLSTYLFIKQDSNSVVKNIFFTAIIQMIVISIYQSYFLFGVILFIIYQICDLLNNKFDYKRNIEFFSSIVLSFALYYFINKLVIFLLNFLNESITNVDSAISISNYQGINLFLNNSLLSGLSFNGLVSKLFSADSILFEKNYYIYVIIYISILILYVFIFAKERLSYKTLFLVILYTILLILVSNSLYVLDGLGTVLYALPMFPKCMLFLLPLVLLEKYNYNINIIIYILLFYYLTYNIVLANNIYLNRYFTLENEKRWCNTLVTRIQSTTGYSDEYDIFIYGERIGANIAKHDNHYVNNLRFIKTIFPYNNDSINQYNFASFLEYYSGFRAWGFHLNDKSFDTNFINSMPCYPDDGSIKVVDNKIIIKFSNFDN